MKSIFSKLKRYVNYKVNSVKPNYVYKEYLLRSRIKKDFADIIEKLELYKEEIREIAVEMIGSVKQKSQYTNALHAI